MIPTKIEQHTRLTLTHVFEDGDGQQVRKVIEWELPVSITVQLEERQGVIVPTIELDIGPHWDPDVDIEVEENPGNRIVTYEAPNMTLTSRERVKSIPPKHVKRDDW